MKVQFSKAINYIPEWNGNRSLPDEQQIKVVFKPLTMGDLLELMDAMQEMSLDIDPENLVGTKSLQANAKQVKILVETCGHLLPNYVTMTGLTDADDEAVEVSQLTNYTYYMEFAGELLNQLALTSMPTDAEEKNLVAQSG